MGAAAATTFHMAYEDERCSAVFIDSNGRALTALHCVEGCLIAAGRVHAVPLGHPLPKGEQMLKNQINLAQPVSCAGEFSQKGRPQPIAIQVLKVFGPGFLSPRASLYDFSLDQPAEFSQALADGYGGAGDLVLIQLPLPKTACAPLVMTDLARPVSLFGISYPIVFRVLDPSQSFNPPTLMAFGTQKLFSVGEGTSDFAAVPLAPEVKAQIGPQLPPGTFLTSVDAEPGASGSPLFNSKAELTGIVRATFNPDGTQYQPWLSEGIDLAPFLPEILQLVPENSKCAIQEDRAVLAF
jgi:hypothetical protein